MNTLENYAGFPEPSVKSPRHKEWRLRVAIGVFLACAITRTPYYFSVSGSDSNDDLSESAPKQTIRAMQTVLGGGTNRQILLKRGDEWRTTTGLTLSGTRAIGAYGAGDKPQITQAITTWTSGWMQQGSTARYNRTSTASVSMVAMPGQRMNRFIRARSTAEVEAITRSFYYDGLVLHINTGGNPNSGTTVEAYTSNSTCGTTVSGNFNLVAGVATWGWGCGATFSVNQCEGIHVTGGINAIVDSDSHYCGSHAMAYYSSGSGASDITLIMASRAGYPQYAGGESAFNSCAAQGAHTTLAIACCVTAGTLRSTDWSYTTGSYARVGTQF